MPQQKIAKPSQQSQPPSSFERNYNVVVDGINVYGIKESATKTTRSARSKHDQENLSPIFTSIDPKNFRKVTFQRTLPAALLGQYVYLLSRWSSEISTWKLLIPLIYWRKHIAIALFVSVCSDLLAKQGGLTGQIICLKLSIKYSVAYFAIQERTISYPINFLDRKDTQFKKLHATCDVIF